MKPKCIIFDLDGTLSDNRSGENIDHNASLYSVNPIRVTRDLFFDYKYRGFDVILLTARSESYKSDTEAWLSQNHIIPSKTYMRSKNDERSDADYKRDIIINQIMPEFEILAAFDDHKPVVEMLRSLGIVTFDVAGNDY